MSWHFRTSFRQSVAYSEALGLEVILVLVIRHRAWLRRWVAKVASNLSAPVPTTPPAIATSFVSCTDCRRNTLWNNLGLMVLSVLEVLVGMTSPIMVANCRCCFSSFGVLIDVFSVAQAEGVQTEPMLLKHTPRPQLLSISKITLRASIRFYTFAKLFHLMSPEKLQVAETSRHHHCLLHVVWVISSNSAEPARSGPGVSMQYSFMFMSLTWLAWCLILSQRFLLN